jgi:hypothetical protein
MEELYEQLLQDMELALNELASKVPPPQPVPFASSFVYRHIERMPHQAIVQKLARMITGLRAALLLVRHGLLQEQGVMHRILDDIREDVMFLSYGIFRGETIKHKAFLEDFFQEEFDNPSDPLVSTQSRRIVPRKKSRRILLVLKRYRTTQPGSGDFPDPKCRIFWLCTRSIATDYGDVWRNPSTFSCSRDARYAHRSEPLQK